MLSTRNQEEKSVLPDMPRPGASTASENRLAIARAGGRKERGVLLVGMGFLCGRLKHPGNRLWGMADNLRNTLTVTFLHNCIF